MFISLPQDKHLAPGYKTQQTSTVSNNWLKYLYQVIINYLVTNYIVFKHMGK